ncbi:sugar phosphate isomerase/epimerase family protein [Wenjunlia tyrosinilytica]|jgi:sugar phosphate isomerase/epimerase|uniref:Xylose isomerase n=1 Tax=Wenjunlia tyrosinilytica TaxID=1544741 RepID=A0A917ZP28_9ACTN|nr:sugar phosphate isomerase/epimerase family protein [Wenjunlia tyrosinilytica]GGO87616.1 xylose isomerase [Wenjunlia tyrosinilytica]
MIRFGYGTNGFGDHSLEDALAVVAGLGYDGVGLTLDRRHLDPYDTALPRRLSHLSNRLEELGLGTVVETGGRYLLDPWRKHRPTLLSLDGADRRVDLLLRAVRIASEVNAEAVSFWSGACPAGLPEEEAWERLVRGCAEVIEEAQTREVVLGFEPEPGMFVDTLDRYDELSRRLGFPERLGLTLDIGHCRCLEEQPVDACVRRAAPRLVNVQIEDMRRGVHEHLEFGEGEIVFPPVLSALADCGYQGLVSVELPRHSHAAPEVARRSLEFLRAASPSPLTGARPTTGPVRQGVAP